MRDEILSYLEMCSRERLSLQKGMNFRTPPAVSVVLMSRRPSAPYEDELSADGTELVYEGHDAPRRPGIDPKQVDQPATSRTGQLTENGRFARAIDESGDLRPLVRVYEKLRDGIWSDRGLFTLTDYRYVRAGARRVYKFHMRLADVPDEAVPQLTMVRDGVDRRIIPSWVKQAVYKRDKGRCVLCGASDELHFDHELPVARGGTGLTPENVRILCARHNLRKGARIE